MENVSLILTMITAIAALIAAIAVWKTIAATRDNTKATLLLEFRKIYGSEEMKKGMRDLIHWAKEQGKDKFEEVFRNLRKIHDVTTDINKLDDNRRRFTHYLLEVYQLYLLGIIDNKFGRLAIPLSAADYAISISEPLERAVNEKYNAGIFRWIEKLWGDELTGRIIDW